MFEGNFLKSKVPSGESTALHWCCVCCVARTVLALLESFNSDRNVPLSNTPLSIPRPRSDRLPNAHWFSCVQSSSIAALAMLVPGRISAAHVGSARELRGGGTDEPLHRQARGALLRASTASGRSVRGVRARSEGCFATPRSEVHSSEVCSSL